MTELIAFRGHPRGKVAKPSDIVEALHPIVAEKHIRQPTYGFTGRALESAVVAHNYCEHDNTPSLRDLGCHSYVTTM